MQQEKNRNKVMSRRKITIASCCLVCIIAIYAFFARHEINSELYFKIPNAKNFYPDAYRFINDDSYLELLKRDPKVRDYFKNKEFNFSKYTYLVTCGAPIHSMYYSYKTTLFDDKSEEWCLAWKSMQHCIMIEYENADSSLYIYRLPKNEKLRGFYGN